MKNRPSQKLIEESVQWIKDSHKLIEQVAEHNAQGHHIFRKLAGYAAPPGCPRDWMINELGMLVVKGGAK